MAGEDIIESLTIEIKGLLDEIRRQLDSIDKESIRSKALRKQLDNYRIDDLEKYKHIMKNGLEDESLEDIRDKLYYHKIELDHITDIDWIYGQIPQLASMFTERCWTYILYGNVIDILDIINGSGLGLTDSGDHSGLIYHINKHINSKSLLDEIYYAFEEYFKQNALSRYNLEVVEHIDGIIKQTNINFNRSEIILIASILSGMIAHRLYIDSDYEFLELCISARSEVLRNTKLNKYMYTHKKKETIKAFCDYISLPLVSLLGFNGQNREIWPYTPVMDHNGGAFIDYLRSNDGLGKIVITDKVIHKMELLNVETYRHENIAFAIALQGLKDYLDFKEIYNSGQVEHYSDSGYRLSEQKEQALFIIKRTGCIHLVQDIIEPIQTENGDFDIDDVDFDDYYN